MMLRMNNDGSDYGSWEAGIEIDPSVYSSDEAYARALQEAEEREVAARLLALAGLNDITGEVEEDTEEDEDNSQDAIVLGLLLVLSFPPVFICGVDTWEEVDPDEFSYEVRWLGLSVPMMLLLNFIPYGMIHLSQELLALGEVVGTESRGLSADTIASLPSINYKTGSSQNGSNDSCVICRLDYEDGETLTLLSCKHSYHSECINNWLKINKACPVCNTEVSTSAHS
ncbi:hypothetical protein POTOM_020960 [Populus tomentosa]|uniref:RING-type domain-containing protein n=1 Tax=Populus tomentosa TaxID=118781 RepID=A0A8X7ZT49_POPTO|nr:hypothetical protein POTOM_020960 [Populus tomentosa]